MGADCTREHLLAKSLGGTDDPENVVAAHAECNSAVGSLSVEKKKQLRIVGHQLGRSEMIFQARRMRRADAREAFAVYNTRMGKDGIVKKYVRRKR